ncbi:hypothetical protein P4H66_06155 [Paenibacillus dokdonensis]|uniref:Uncharacterized protein n=1 Tax=Paenibacillus dokdonensis TaxID=2567944 RepID=A0ABU6GMQ7_9BACL|nr:hypothetical protein [Paenibacillus dokdonensis]MEC0239437.1 hypothetical protein [Paenibacillus dokdonensis]
MKKPVKVALAAAAVTVYCLCPAYRYYVIGSWIGLKIMRDKPRKPRVVPKNSRLYEKVKAGLC